jgi:outer membrane protein assembly factor BamB
LVFCLFAAAGVTAAAGETPSWSEFHGPARDNISPEKGLLREWPADGPPLVWRFGECGTGYACVTIADGLVFTSGDFGDDERLLALDMDGRLKWQITHGKAWKGAQAGARTAPTCDDGLLYHLNPNGALSAFAADTGKQVWTVDLRNQFGAQPRSWGYTESVIIEGDMLLCMVGARQGRVVAFNKKTGAMIWANTEIADSAAYSSPIIVTHNGVRQMIALARESVLGVEIKTGKLLWTAKHPSTCDQNVTTPIYHDGSVFVTSGHRAGGRVVRLSADSTSAQQLWHGTELDNCHGGVVLLNGYLYGSGCRLYGRGLLCVDFATGDIVYNAKEIGKVSITYADNRLYCLGNDCSMTLVDVSPKEARVVSKFQPPWKNKPPCLSHPVVCGGRLYIRHLDDLLVYDIRAKQ